MRCGPTTTTKSKDQRLIPDQVRMTGREKQIFTGFGKRIQTMGALAMAA